MTPFSCCAAARCQTYNLTNSKTAATTTTTPGISLHRWPIASLFPEQASSWRRFVQAEPERNDWKPLNESRSSSSRLCSFHFDNSCFKNYIKFTLGFSKCLNLLPGAVPTIQCDRKPVPANNVIVIDVDTANDNVNDGDVGVDNGNGNGNAITSERHNYPISSRTTKATRSPKPFSMVRIYAYKKSKPKGQY